MTLRWLTVLGFALFAPALPADEVILQSGITIKGRVIERDAKKVVVDAGGRTMTYKAGEVAGIRLDSVPEFDEGNRLLAAGSVAAAASAFEKVVHGPRTLFQEDARARLVHCYFRTGRPDDAVSTFLEMLKQSPDSRHIFSFPWQYGAKPRNAAGLLSLMATNAGAVPIAPALEAWVLLAEGKGENGQSKVSALIQSKDPVLKELGVILRLRLLFEAKKYDECVKLIGERMATLSEAGVPWAYYWRGRCRFARKDYLHGVLDELRVATLYRTNEPLAGESLYWVGQCFERMGKADRAKKEYMEAATQFPVSIAAGPARERAAAIK